MVAALKEMNKETGSLSFYLFAIKYGKFLKSQNLSEIIRSANLTESMSKDLSKGLQLYNLLTSNKYGIELREENGSVVLDADAKNNLSLSQLADILFQMETERSEFGIGATAAAFGFMYGKAMTDANFSSGSIIDEARKRHSDFSLTHTHDATIQYGINLYLMLEKGILGFHFQKSHHSPNIFQDVQGMRNFPFLPYLPALRTKPFMLLAGVSGTGKSRIARKLAQATVTEELQRAAEYDGTDFANDRWTLHSPANFELVQVKPNWHNSMDVVGYLSNIPTPHYVFTPFVEFVAKAWLHPEVPFFLCLDEMNLAPVEEYFAEFLSAIESRGFEDGEYITDPIIKPFSSFGCAKDEKGAETDIGDAMASALFPYFKASDTETETAKVVEHFRTRGLTLPKNLIVIGTVNMDETTFSFSRKVLDRAMSVEMNEVNYDCFLTDTTDDDLKAIVNAFEENGDADLNKLLVDRHIEAREIIDELGEDAKFAIDYLKRTNALLEGSPFKLGYRAANEALIYLKASYEFGQTDRIAALDNFTLMKILSRVEGDETKLKITDTEADKSRISAAGVNVDEAKRYGDLNLLTALRYIITQELGGKETPGTEEDPTREAAQGNTAETAPAPKGGEELLSIKKIDGMLSQLRRDHFVSYWN